MPVIHARPSTPEEQALEAYRSGVSGAHVWINGGRQYLQDREGWWRGLKLWWRAGCPRTGKEAASRVYGR